MKNQMNRYVIGFGFTLILIAIVLSAGCIKSILPAGDRETHDPLSTAPQNSPEKSIEVAQITGTVAIVPVPTQVSAAGVNPKRLEVNEINPSPYVTPVQYSAPYRDLNNWTSTNPEIIRVPEYTKKIVLRSNSTAFRMNVTKGPLIISLTFNPVFPNPDQSHKVGKNVLGNEESLAASGSSVSQDSGGDSDSSDGSNAGLVYSFVYSSAEISVIDTATNITEIKDGYRGIYSSDLKKTITLYREGPCVIVLEGKFVDVDLSIATGTAPVITRAPVTTPDPWTGV